MGGGHPGCSLALLPCEWELGSPTASSWAGPMVVRCFLSSVALLLLLT